MKLHASNSALHLGHLQLLESIESLALELVFMLAELRLANQVESQFGLALDAGGPKLDLLLHVLLVKFLAHLCLFL